MVDPEPAPGAPEPGHHLVRDEQDPVAPADLGDRLPVAIGRDDGRQRRADDRLRDERGDGARARRLDRALQLGGELLGIAERVRPRLARPIRVRRGDVPESPEPGLVRAPERLASRQVQGAERVAVIAPPPGDDDPALQLAARDVVRPGQLQGRLDRLRPAGDRVDRRIVHGQVRREGRRVALERLAS